MFAKGSVFILALGILQSSTVFSAAWRTGVSHPANEMTPANAVEILYTHIKRGDYLPLLEYSTGPEARRLQSLISNIKSDRNTRSLVRRQAQELSSYRIHQQEIHTNIAAIMFTWQFKRNSAPCRAHGRPAIILVEEGCAALLVKKNNAWKIASVRSWVPENERGYAFFQRQQATKKRPDT